MLQLRFANSLTLSGPNTSLLCIISIIKANCVFYASPSEQNADDDSSLTHETSTHEKGKKARYRHYSSPKLAWEDARSAGNAGPPLPSRDRFPLNLALLGL